MTAKGDQKKPGSEPDHDEDVSVDATFDEVLDKLFGPKPDDAKTNEKERPEPKS